MSLASTLNLLKAAADPTRLRLLALLSAGESTVGELVEVLAQSQPRVSRHLKLLSEARLLSHFRDGQWMYYRLAGEAVSLKLVNEILAAASGADALLDQDRSRMSEIRQRRERYALTTASGPRQWAQPQGDRPSEAALRQALEEALGAGPLGEVLDVGTGSGTLLRLVGARASAAVGLDTSRGMRVLARSRLQQAGLAHCTIRAGDMHALQFPDHAFDVVILDDVLALSRRPLEALGEAVRVLRPAGRVVILDRILPAVRRLPAQPRDGSLFENQLAAMLRGAGLRLTHRTWFPGRNLEHALFTAAVRPAPARTGTDG